MKKLFSKIGQWLYRFFIESDGDRVNRERVEKGKAPFIYY